MRMGGHGNCDRGNSVCADMHTEAPAARGWARTMVPTAHTLLRRHGATEGCTCPTGGHPMRTSKRSSGRTYSSS